MKLQLHCIKDYFECESEFRPTYNLLYQINKQLFSKILEIIYEQTLTDQNVGRMCGLMDYDAKFNIEINNIPHSSGFAVLTFLTTVIPGASTEGFWELEIQNYKGQIYFIQNIRNLEIGQL